jgi:hypothetical protein
VRTDRNCDGQYRSLYNRASPKHCLMRSNAATTPCPYQRRAASAMRPNKACSRPPCWCDFLRRRVLTASAAHTGVLIGRRLMQAVRPPHTRSIGSRTHQSRVRVAPDVPQRHFPAVQFLRAHSGFTLVTTPRSLVKTHPSCPLWSLARHGSAICVKTHPSCPCWSLARHGSAICAPPSLLADHTPGPRKRR